MTSRGMAGPFDALMQRIERMAPPVPSASGRVLRYDGLIVETTGFPASPGALCRIDVEDSGSARRKWWGSAMAGTCCS